jgi:hypothetical protein
VGFDITNVVGVLFSQAGELAGDQIWIGAVAFEHNAVNHCEAAGDWYFDVPGGIGDTIQTSTDRMFGYFSIQATGHASSWGQMDIATSQAVTDVTWNWANKTYLTFYYNDSYPDVSHYAAIYDNNGNYTQWVFQTIPGEWNKITVALADNSYYAYASAGPPDLSQITSFEVGIFGGTPYAPYTFLVDELTVH